MKVNVDRDMCCASGMCESVVSEVFTIADSGEVQVNDAAVDANIDKVRRAIIECPTQALSLSE
ncbi:ferredoxin [Williamsia sp. CHRR-6]|uniref:ferredoxin n=1 Tax=Williamsia sp. CHRR-6 TaxID=2835871 RepID=UPI001BDB0534|nr:ferredoxin [Williamsia sp. CHRR-6]MBT0568523.1 ferredoxin [Williamsia sp. CHRR-6]